MDNPEYLKACIWIISFTLVIADACIAANRKCETKYFTKMFIKNKYHQNKKEAASQLCS